mgnify:CR=1 FL=1
MSSRTVQPFLTEHCLRCHGPEKEKGNLRVDTMLPADFSSAATRAMIASATGSSEYRPVFRWLIRVASSWNAT